MSKKGRVLINHELGLRVNVFVNQKGQTVVITEDCECVEHHMPMGSYCRTTLERPDLMETCIGQHTKVLCDRRQKYTAPPGDPLALKGE